jgi:cytoskeletal protein RodZ
MLVPRELGITFKQVREERGISITEVNRRTKIPATVIRDIEEGDFERLGKIYMKSFIKKYSDFLGLDTAEMSDKFEAIVKNEEIPPEEVKTIYEKVLTPPADKIMQEEDLIQPVPMKPAKPIKQEKPVKPAKPMPPIQPSSKPEPIQFPEIDLTKYFDIRVIAAGVIALIMVIIVIGMLKSSRNNVTPSRKSVEELIETKNVYGKPSSNETTSVDKPKTEVKTTVKEEVPAPVVEKAKEVEPASAEADKPVVEPAKPAEKTPQVVKDGPVTLDLKATGEVWIQVFDGDKTVFVGTLRKGDTKTLNAEKSLTVWTGKGEFLEFVVNGKDVGKVRDGVVRDIKVTSGGIEIGNKKVINFE